MKPDKMSYLKRKQDIIEVSINILHDLAAIYHIESLFNNFDQIQATLEL